jgi:hypothetical protein
MVRFAGRKDSAIRDSVIVAAITADRVRASGNTSRTAPVRTSDTRMIRIGP